MAKPIPGQSAPADNYQLVIFWQNERRTFRAVDPSSPSWNLPFGRCSTSLLGLSFNSSHPPVPTTSPQGTCTNCCPFCAKHLLMLTSFFNQDLAGFFTSIDQERFIRSWFMLLDFLRPKMNVYDDEVFSVYPGKSNNPGDIIKGRTFRRLNVTRKIIIKHVPDLIRSALDMQTFALGKRCVRQRRGSPMGSPLSPALCLMVVSISEQIWSNTFRHIISNHHLFIRHIRYVDNRLIFGDKRLTEMAPYEVLLDDGFYGKPIILETEPDQEFLGFMIETKPLEVIYQGPTNISQVLSPFSASPPAVLLSGFRSRCHIVIKGAFPASRVQQGLTQLIHLYSRAGFPKEELQTISDQLSIQHQNFPSQCKTKVLPAQPFVVLCFFLVSCVVLVFLVLVSFFLAFSLLCLLLLVL